MLKKISILFVSLVLFGCGGSSMTKPSEIQSLSRPAEDKAQIVFMRVSNLGAAIGSSIYDVTTEETKLIGFVSTGTKITYEVTPGEHTFMVVGESADFMQANVEAGETYYAVVAPRMGVWSARFSLKPFKADATSEFQLESADLDKWLNSTKIVENNEKGTAWYEANKAKVETKRKKYWESWNAKTDDQKLEVTLTADDGQS